MKFFVTLPAGDVRDTFLPPYVKARLAAMGEVAYNETGANLTSDTIAPHLKGVDVVITGWGAPCFNEVALAQADRLRNIVHTGGSVAALADKALYDRGIRLTSGNAMYAESVAEGVVGYALAGLRAIPYYSGRLTQGEWYGARGFRSRALLDARVNLVGFGAIPGYLCNMLRPFRCQVRAYDKYAPEAAFARFGAQRIDNLEDSFSDCDIVSLHLPLTGETRGLIGAQLLSRIPDGALLINTARGAVFQEDALIAELKKGRFDAVLDVYSQEPPPQDNPLRTLPNVICMPHMAGPTLDRRPRITMALLDDLERPESGEYHFEIGYEYAKRMTKE